VASSSALLLPSAEALRRGYLRGAEHRAEANEAVEVNLDPWEIAAWRKHRYDKRPDGTMRFRGTPDQKALAFREWLEAHEREATHERAAAAEKKTKKEIKAREARAGVAVPCKTPYRFRTKAACKSLPPNRQPKWTRSSLLSKPGRHVEVPCDPPNRPRVKELCEPSKSRWGKAWTSPVSDEPEHAFAGLL